jgi:UDP-2,3-diacylglucosamine pyrophosphatase LpxH
MTTFLVIGDVHIKTDNIQEVDIFIEKIKNLALEKKPDIIILLGDILHEHERIHTTSLNKAYELIDILRQIQKTYVLVGNHDMCLGKDVPVLMWNGTIKMSQDIKIGDVLVGDDGEPRNVYYCCHGNDESYLVKQLNGIDYIVNKNHLLSLKCGFHKSVFYNNTKQRWVIKWIDINTMSLKSKFFINKEEAQEALDIIDNIESFDISIEDYLKVPKNVRERLYGYKTSFINWPYKKVQIDPYVLGLWLGDGSKTGDSFASADVEIIQSWHDWVEQHGGEIIHTGQYNYYIRNSITKYRGRNTLDICDEKHSTKNCKACINHINKYKRAPSLICANVKELELLLNGDFETINYFSNGASKEQQKFLLNYDNLLNLKLWKEKKQKKDIIYIPTHKKGILKYFLKNYNLQNNKHIPQDYIVNSEEIRLQLLAGFIDTDGHVVDGRSIIICQSGLNNIMIEQLDIISKSLGFISSIKSDQNNHKKKIHISGDITKIPTKLFRKKCITISNKGKKNADKTRTSINVIPVGKQDYYGFSVDKNNRFLLGDMTVTHNCNNQVFLTNNHWMNGMKEWLNVIIVDDVKELEINNELFIFCPYVYPGRFIEALNTLELEKWKNASCIFAHQEFYGCKMGAITSIEGDKWSLDYPFVISGHIHNKQSPQANIYYTGSSLQIAFGESENNTILYLTVNNKKLIKDEISLELSRKKILYMDIEDMENFKIPNTSDKIKITLSGNQEQFKTFKKTKKYKNLIENNIKVVFKHTKIQIKKQKEEIIKNQEIQKFNENENINTDINFTKVLYDIIMDKKDNYLYQAYQLVVNNKEVNSEDILLL